MRSDEAVDKGGERPNLVHILVLLAAALGIGVYLICTAFVVAPDGITFLDYARDLEDAPSEAILGKAQHPGYPLLILGLHEVAGLFWDASSPFGWIYSAQAAALAFRLLAICAVYLLGAKLVGARYSFLATLALIFLPDPARHGSDALSDWPHMFFLVTGLLLLLRGALDGRWWLFGLAGVSAGAGYLIRPECIQIVIYGFLWLILQTLQAKRTMNARRTVLAMAVLLLGFCVFAVPYMHFKKAVFPKKSLTRLVPDTKAVEYSQSQPGFSHGCILAADIYSQRFVGSAMALFDNIGETVVWLFLPGLFVGVYVYLDKRSLLQPRQFFVVVPIALNVLLVMWLHDKYGYMSRRHTLPLVVISILMLPLGVKVWASWLCKAIGRLRPVVAQDRFEHWVFLVLFVAGIAVGVPKLLRPLHDHAGALRQAAEWLRENSPRDDVIAVSDSRVRFYSGREGVVFGGADVPETAKYVVEVLDHDEESHIDSTSLQMRQTVSGGSGNLKAIIYSRMP